MIRNPLALILIPLLAVIAVMVPGCGDETTTQTDTQPTQTASNGTYSNSVADTARLLRDSSTAMKQIADEQLGVHYSYTSNDIGAEQLVIAQGEGDMVFPDRTSVTSNVFVTGESTIIELIAIGEDIYVKSVETGNTWRQDDRGILPPNPRNVWNYLDFARSSRNLGITTMPDGIQAYQVRVEIDADLLAKESMKHYSDPRIIALLEAARTATVSAIVWIGVDDLLVYKQSIQTVNEDESTSSEQLIDYSNWGESVEISQPCVIC